MSHFEPVEGTSRRSRASTAYFSADDQFLGSAPVQSNREESSPVQDGLTKGILTGGKKRGGVKWRDANPTEDAPAERIKHFEFTDAPAQIAQEPEFGGPEFSVPDDTREHPWHASQVAMMNHRAGANEQRRSGALQRMVMGLPRAEQNMNTYAQDLGTDELLQRPKARPDQSEMDDLIEESERSRRVQSRALGVQGYAPEDRGRIIRRANAAPSERKPGFFSKMMSSMGLGRVFGSPRSGARTFDAVPRRPQARGWFQKLFGTSGRRRG